MRIAYLILCHKNPQQVQKLIDTLQNENVDFYIHIDKKAENFTLLKKQNVFLLPEEYRVDVKWATKSMVDATLNLMTYMLKKEKAYDYVALLSGQDFPIKSNRRIFSHLAQKKGANYIELLPHSDGMYKRYSKRNQIYYPKWMFDFSFKTKVLKRLYIYLTGGYQKTFSVFRRKFSYDISFEYGSQWWCLTYDCVRWMFDYVERNSWFLEFFENALTPDECFFQTLFMLSPYKETACDRITFLRWGKNKNNPEILQTEDFVFLINSPYLFARKFDMSVDAIILEKLTNFCEDETDD